MISDSTHLDIEKTKLADIQWNLSRCYHHLGDVFLSSNIDSAEKYYKKSYALDKAMFDKMPDSLEYVNSLAIDTERLGDILYQKGN